MIKHLLFILILTISLSIFSISTNAAMLYVDVNGADTNNGSSDSPFRTIQKGVDAASPGDTVHVGAGTYYERVTFTTDGSAGNRITIEGEEGTIVDGSDEVGNWTPVGSGVYSQNYATAPGSMYVLDSGVPIDIPCCRTGSCSSYMNYSATQPVTTNYLNVTIDWWDGIEATFRHSNSTLYVRFRDGSDPNSKTIRVSPDGGKVFDLRGSSYITLKDMEIRGAHSGIYITGSTSNNLVIDNCTIYATGRNKIYIGDFAHDIEVKNSTMYESGAWLLGSYTPGPWQDGSIGSAGYAQAVREWIYYCYKQHLGDEGASDVEGEGVRVFSSGDNILIHDNTIYNFPSESVYVRDPAGTVSIYNNTIYGNSSMGIYVSYDDSDNGSELKIYNNLIYNNNINIRKQGTPQNQDDIVMYVYNNRMHLDNDIGTHFFFHTGGTPSSLGQAEIWIYHNSFSGGWGVFDIPYNASDFNLFDSGRVINNIFSGDGLVMQTGEPAWDDSTFWELWEYNWMGGSYKYSGNPAWGSDGNIYAENSLVWGNASLPDFVLPQGHAARESGIDVSTTFNINGQNFPPLPGIENGYYTNTQPDMGIFRVETARPPKPPYSVRIVSY